MQTDVFSLLGLAGRVASPRRCGESIWKLLLVTSNGFRFNDDLQTYYLISFVAIERIVLFGTSPCGSPSKQTSVAPRNFTNAYRGGSNCEVAMEVGLLSV